MSDCKLCDAGTYNKQNGQTSCQYCPTGKWSNATGLTTDCKSCNTGYYNNQTGQAKCKKCDDNQKSLENRYYCSRFKPLLDGNGNLNATDRVGFLGGVVDDYFQDYQAIVNNVWYTSLDYKTSNSMSTAQVIAEYGYIQDWNTLNVTNMQFVFYFKKNNPDISGWDVSKVTNMIGMFIGASFNQDLSYWDVSKVTDMSYMFYYATAYNQTLCGNTWIDSTATKTSMFSSAGGGTIGTVPCLYNACGPGKYLTTTTPKTCVDCPDEKYQDEQGFTGTSCTKECDVNQKSSENRYYCSRFKPLPEGNGKDEAAHRVGSLGGVVDDYYQDYYGGIGNKPINSKTKAEVIAKYGSIEHWNVLGVTNMGKLFNNKNINPVIGNWQVDSVTNMKDMFRNTISFNQDLSYWDVSKVTDMRHMFSDAKAFNQDLNGWDVSKVTDMSYMFDGATAYNQTLCGNTWIESDVDKTSMFGSSDNKIGTVPCTCSPGKYLNTTTQNTCVDCSAGQYQDERGFKGASCTECESNYSSSGASSCGPCPKGTYAVDPKACVSCGAGNYSDHVGSTSCKECSLYLFDDKTDCILPGSDPLPEGNGKDKADDRVGYLGGVVDDYFQDYNGDKPSNSKTKASVIAKYGPIETWDTSKLTNMKFVFLYKKDINIDIQNWQVDKVTTMEGMFAFTNSFNSNISNWDVSKVTDMFGMFYKATAFTQTLCGNTWIDSNATNKPSQIDTVICSCSPGQYFTAENKTCTDCSAGKYQDKQGFKEQTCSDCAVNTFSDMGAVSCSICTAATVGRNCSSQPSRAEIKTRYNEGDFMVDFMVLCGNGTTWKKVTASDKRCEIDTYASVVQPSRAEIKARYSKGDCNGFITLCGNGTIWKNGTSSVKHCEIKYW